MTHISEKRHAMRFLFGKHERRKPPGANGREVILK
jgi:hypothetical protein